MKKWTTVLLSVIMVLGITACGKEKVADGGEANAAANKSTNQEVTAGSGNEGANNQVETGVPTVEEFLQKAAEASEKLNSFTMDADIDQNMVISQGDQQQEQKIKIKTKADLIKEPLEMYQNMDLDMGEQGSQNIEQYITQNGIYMKVDGSWTKVPDEMRDQLLESIKQSSSPEKQLEQFQSITKDAKIVEDGDDYVLTADLSGDGLKELAQSLMNQAAGENEQTAAMMEQMNIKNIKISYAVNKETYLPTISKVDMMMDMDVEGQSVSLDMKVDSKFSNYDGVEKLEVPQEALNSAQ